MKRIYIDMDGVICDYDRKAEELGYPLDDASHHPGFFKSLKPIEGAIDSIRELEKHYDVWILTAASWSNSLSFHEKIIWIKKHLPEIAKSKHAIFSNDKSLLKGDYLIDDRNVNKQDQFEGEWLQFGSEDFPDWKSIMAYIK